MTEMEKNAAERLRDALEDYMRTPCPNSAPCIFCEIASECAELRALHFKVKQKLGEEVDDL